MKKTVRLISAVICVLMLAALCASCAGGQMTRSGQLYEGEYTPTEAGVKSVDRVSEINLAFESDCECGFILSREDDSYSVYDMVTGTVVRSKRSFVGAVELTAHENDGARCFAITVTGTSGAETTLYDEKGNEIASAKNTSPIVKEDLIAFNNRVYRFDTNGVNVLEGANIGNFNCIEEKHGRFYFDFNYGKSNLQINVYDGELKLHDTILTDRTDDGASCVLSNGNILLQNIYHLPDDADKYTVFVNENKLEVKTLLYNIEGKTVKELTTEWLLEGGRSFDRGYAGMTVTDKIENIIVVSPIKDGRRQNSILLAIGNDGSVKYDLSGICHSAGATLPVPCGKDRYINYDPDRNSMYLSDSDDNYLGGLGTVLNFVNGMIISDSGYIFDTDMNVLFDMKAEGYNFQAICGKYIIFDKDGKYYRFDGSGLLSTYDTGVVNVFREGYYYTYPKSVLGSGLSTICDPDGRLLYSTEGQIREIYKWENKVLMGCTDGTSTEYIIITLN